MNKTLLLPALMLYSLLWEGLFLLARLFAWFIPGIQEQVRGRILPKPLLARLQELRATKPKTVLFYCSSAGEYEQARPLIDRLERQGVGVAVAFFSQSGMQFVVARQDPALCFQAPIDSLWRWHVLFSILEPQACLVVRHELWPAFLSVASTRSSVYLIDATETESLDRRPLARAFKGKLLNFFHRVYVATPADADFFHHRLEVPKERLRTAGDSKYDRACERATLTREATNKMGEEWQRAFGPRRRLIIGSAWHQDVDLVLAAYGRLMREGLLQDWQLVIAPHDTSLRMIEWIEGRCASLSYPTLRMSEMNSVLSSHLAHPPVVVVDQMGVLAELYGLCRVAFIGGALHHKVHNVLEPACRGLYMTYGPRYRNSREARQFVENGLVETVANADDLVAWWRRHLIYDGPNADMLDFVSRQCGAADQIVRDILAPEGQRG